MTTTVPVPTASAVDLHDLERLRHRAANDESAALAEAAVQFEALFIGMMLDSARNARLGNGLFDGPQTKQYFELMDQQVAIELARSGGLGFGRMLTEQLAPRSGLGEEHSPASLPLPGRGAPHARGAPQMPADEFVDTILPPVQQEATVAEFPRALPASLAMLAVRAEEEQPTQQPTASPEAERFVARFLDEASEAATTLGVEPRLLLAQVALETGWGRSLEAQETPANNLFGVKAGANWSGERREHWTLEQGAAGLERRREVFRSYDSTASSFADYVDLVARAPRYAAAAANAGNAENYVRSMVDGGYATDPHYADKWLSIYHGERLVNALRSVTTK